jgi:hypothetical protein
MNRRTKAPNVGRSIFVLIWVAVCAAASANWATAGQNTSASITGRISDETGGALPGVTVTAKSPTLQIGALTAITDSQGNYRLTPLPIGTYTVSYELSGFQSVEHQDIQLTVGFIATIDVVLKVGSVQETLTVTGASPVVDIKSTTTGFQMTREFLDLLPTTRNGVPGILNHTPGVRSTLDVGGSGVNSSVTVHAYGQGGEQYYTVEGVYTGDPTSGGGGGNYFDQSGIQDAQIKTIGGDADVPSRGVQTALIIKSGGNAFHGSGSWNQTSRRFQSTNIDDALRAQGISSGNELLTRWDGQGDLGGKIVEDKLWFYFGARKRHEEQAILGYTLPDGSAGGSDQSNTYSTGKLSYQMSKANKFTGFYTRGHKFDQNVTSRFVAWESRTHFHPVSLVGKGEWQIVPTDSLMASVQFGYWSSMTGLYTGHSSAVATIDRATGFVTGEWTSSQRGQSKRRPHVKGTLTWYRRELLGGNHQFQFGFDHQQGWIQGNPSATRLGVNYQLVFNNGAPLQLVSWNTPAESSQNGRYSSVFIQDSWTLGRRLTLNLGVRYAHDVGYIPSQCRRAADPPGDAWAPAQCFPEINFNTWNPVSPRLHASYALTDDAKTVIKGGWGRFAHMRNWSQEEGPSDPGSTQTATYRWHDLNVNRDFDPGEVNFDPNGPDFVSVSGGPTSVPNPNEREPYTHEMSLSLEREVARNFLVRVTGVYTRNQDVYRRVNTLRPPSAYSNPVTRIDPGPDGIAATADDPGRSITYYEYPASLAGAKFTNFMLTNDDRPQTFRTIEFGGEKRLSNRWMLQAYYSATKIHVPFVNGLVPSEASPQVYAADLDPNSEINTENNTWEWTTRLQGAYTFAHGVLASVSFAQLSGNPFARTVLFTGGVLSSITLNAEPIGTRRLPSRNVVDLRTEKRFRVGRQNFDVRAILFNLLNSNVVLSQTALSGVNFLKPTSILPPRIVEFGVSYSF